MKRGSAQYPGARLKSLLQPIINRRGGDKSDVPGWSAGHLGARGAGRSAPPLPAEKEPCKGGTRKGARGEPEATLPGPRDAPWGCGLARRARAGRKDRGAGSPRAATAGGRRAARRPGVSGGGVVAGAARSPAAARAPASRAAAATAAATAAAAPPRRLLHLCGGSSGSARRRHQQQHSETSLPSRDPTPS